MKQRVQRNNDVNRRNPNIKIRTRRPGRLTKSQGYQTKGHPRVLHHRFCSTTFTIRTRCLAINKRRLLYPYNDDLNANYATKYDNAINTNTLYHNLNLYHVKYHTYDANYNALHNNKDNANAFRRAHRRLLVLQKQRLFHTTINKRSNMNIMTTKPNVNNMTTNVSNYRRPLSTNTSNRTTIRNSTILHIR